jgi:hypothetical protein
MGLYLFKTAKSSWSPSGKAILRRGIALWDPALQENDGRASWHATKIYRKFFFKVGLFLIHDFVTLAN